MDDAKVMDMFVKLMEQLHTSNAKINEMLANHETRITVLEKTKNDDWKTNLLMLLAKALVIGAVAVGSLVGAGGIISKIVGV